ncbi:hypothetical protein LZC95_19650 [Pendulispora brunnea]|uniref:Uncharacterized protein n=1 Tax=Pendulispora brunnea TaxID=2905690 RepID=A0ABZ2KNV8_9BACT
MSAALAFELHRRQAEAAHLREETLETVNGERFQVAASPWCETKYARACHVAVGFEGRIFAVYSLWHSRLGPERRLSVVAGDPDYDVTREVLKRFRARLGRGGIRQDAASSGVASNSV